MLSNIRIKELDYIVTTIIDNYTEEEQDFILKDIKSIDLILSLIKYKVYILRMHSICINMLLKFQIYV